MPEDEDEGVGRVREPEGKEVLGVVLRKEGGGKYRVYCTDERERICRIPGSKKRGLFVKRDSLVMVNPWDIQGDEKGDVVHSYSNAETRYLEDEGYLDAVKEFL